MGRWKEDTAAMGEVIVETGAGIIDKLDDDPQKRNAHVAFRATHTALRELVTGWVDKSSPAWPLVQEAAAGRFEVDYRVEVHRRRGVDLKTPIADLSNRDKVRDLVVCARAGELPTNEATPPARHEPQDDAAPPTAGDADPETGWLAQAQREHTEQRRELAGNGNGAPASSGARCAPCDYDAPDTKAMLAHARSPEHLARLADTPAADRPTGPPASPPSSPHADRDRPVPPRPGVKVAEGRRWEAVNSDGSPNLNSFAYGAVVDFLEFAHYLVAERQAVEAPDEPANLRAVEALARTLLEAADRVQANTRRDGRHDRMDGSHYQARSTVRTALKVHPVPFGSSADVRAKWLTELVAHASALAGIALDLYRESEGLA